MEKIFRDITEFIRALYAKPEGPIPLHAPVFNGNEKKYLGQCIDTTYVSSIGKFVDLFEEKIAVYTGSRKAVVCVNGTNALHLALLLSGVEREDEVITQPLTFVATANAIRYCSAHPVFLDVDQDTLGLSPQALERFLSLHAIREKDGCYNRLSRRKIAAVLPMHTFGHPARIDEITAICKRYDIPMVEDAAESMGSLYKGQHTGTFGRIGVLSFNGNKILTTGGGGMMLFQDEALARRARHLTTQAKVPHPWEFGHDETGFNYRMPNINAALGLAQLEQLEAFLASKRGIAEKYRQFFAATPYHFVAEPPDTRSNYWLNSILFPNREERDAFLKFTNERGIMTRPAWRLMNELPMYKNCLAFELNHANVMAQTLVNLPSSVMDET